MQTLLGSANVRLSQGLRALVSSVFVGSRLNRYGARLCYDPGSNWQYISQHHVPEYENRRLKTKALGFPRLVSIGTMMKQSGLASNLCVSDSFKCGPSKCTVDEKQTHHKIQGFGFGHRNLARCRNSGGSAGILGAVQESWGQVNKPPDFYKSWAEAPDSCVLRVLYMCWQIGRAEDQMRQGDRAQHTAPGLRFNPDAFFGEEG